MALCHVAPMLGVVSPAVTAEGGRGQSVSISDERVSPMPAFIAGLLALYLIMTAIKHVDDPKPAFPLLSHQGS